MLGTMRNAFNRAADRTNAALGSVSALILAVLVVVVWALTGPLFRFSDTWQLAINTATTVITFWMVFVIQNSQNRASKAVQLKLDEVIRALTGAENRFIRLEAAPEIEMAEREAEMTVIAGEAAAAAFSGATARP
jgi:low affinity Fe/Cu permease